MKKFLTILIALFVTSLGFGQGVLKGTVTSNEDNSPLIGASVLVEGTTIGTITDADGTFELKNVPTGFQLVNVSYVGFNAKEVPVEIGAGMNDLGSIALETDAYTLDDVVIVGKGVMDIAKDRETPVAVSTISAVEIAANLGTQEFPEILNNTPSVYATRQGGGFGDSRINIRGFDQRNTAVMINGMPVNDMENGWVYWSNWAGLADVTSAMQVQRGLGSSKLAISSVGGTINILTRSANMEQGGSVKLTYGNDNYMKGNLMYNTGLMDNGLSLSALFGGWQGDGFVDGTKGNGFNYYLALGYRPSDKHDFQLTVTGAPQRHNQRGYAESIASHIKYGGEDGEPNIKYNGEWGLRDGEEETFGGNFYHKPIASLNWDWELGKKSKLSTVAYASLGRGGSVGSIGRIAGGKPYYSQFKDENGTYKFDEIIKYNTGQAAEWGTRETYSGGGVGYEGKFVNSGSDSYGFENDYSYVKGDGNGISQRSSMNSHNWFGLISNFNQQLTDNLTFDVGLDLRTYKGIHYRRLVDLMGADAYVDNDNINNTYRFITETYAPTVANTWNVFKNPNDEVKIDYYNEGLVNWAGVFGQLEYKKDALSAFLQGSVSQQGFKRIDYFNYLDSDPLQSTDWINILGGNVKGGANYNINENHNIFANAGYYSKQPLFDAIFLNYVNDINEDYKNEKVIGLELGYGLRTDLISANFNLYRTSWADRFKTESSDFDVNNTPDDDDDDIRGVANLYGIEQVHMGLELDFILRALDNLDVFGMFSMGDWQYASDVNATYFDDGQNPIVVNGVEQSHILYLDGVKVGDAAQLTSRIGADYKIMKGLKLNLAWRYADRLYADISPEDFDSEDHDGSLQLPSFHLLDGGLSYFFGLDNKSGIMLRFNMNNILNTTYISDSETNYHPREDDELWNGISTGNRVYFGWGRSWNASVAYKF